MDSGSASRGDRWWRVELCADVCVCTMRVCPRMRVCARLSPRAPSAPSAWEPGHPAAAASALGAQTLAPALRNVLLGGRAGSRPGTGSIYSPGACSEEGLTHAPRRGRLLGAQGQPQSHGPLGYDPEN